eukprot:245835-Amphidinium_carterae.1
MSRNISKNSTCTLKRTAANGGRNARYLRDLPRNGCMSTVKGSPAELHQCRLMGTLVIAASGLVCYHCNLCAAPKVSLRLMLDCAEAMSLSGHAFLELADANLYSPVASKSRFAGDSSWQS